MERFICNFDKSHNIFNANSRRDIVRIIRKSGGDKRAVRGLLESMEISERRARIIQVPLMMLKEAQSRILN